jgi:hypothetical protein
MWKYLAGAAGVALLGFALWLGITKYGDARYDEGRLRTAVDVAQAATESQELANAAYQRGVEQGQQAEITFIKWRDGPLRIQKEFVTREIIKYQQSDSGRAICFDADGVRAANQDISAANATAFTDAAARSDDVVRENAADRDAAGRDGNPRPSEEDDREIRISDRRVREEAPIADRSMAAPLIVNEKD